MKKEVVNGKEYRLPNSLTKFQKEMYVHLINWKWKYITKEFGLYKHKGKWIEYDAILPKSVCSQMPIIYNPIKSILLEHNQQFPFKLHTHFNHMASSQAANINLFLPILLSPNANDILRLLKSDFKELAHSELYKGFRIEYWDGNSNKEKGLLGDHNANSGTDSDIAIAYYNHNEELCLWLIEHKLTEKEFTECGGFDSNGRNKAIHKCEMSFADIIKDKNLCYYHNVRKNNYWKLTDKYESFFANHNAFESCPFSKGMNQLWRNQLLGLAIEDDENNAFKNVYFSVAHHPENHSLDKSINEYTQLINNNPKFSIFTSKDVVEKALTVKNKVINDWVVWYKELYRV